MFSVRVTLSPISDAHAYRIRLTKLTGHALILIHSVGIAWLKLIQIRRKVIIYTFNLFFSSVRNIWYLSALLLFGHELNAIWIPPKCLMVAIGGECVGDNDGKKICFSLCACWLSDGDVLSHQNISIRCLIMSIGVIARYVLYAGVDDDKHFSNGPATSVDPFSLPFVLDVRRQLIQFISIIHCDRIQFSTLWLDRTLVDFFTQPRRKCPK